MHVAHHAVFGQNHHKVFRYEADVAFAHGLGHPYAAVLGHSELSFHHAHVCAVERLGVRHKVGVESGGLHFLQIGCYHLCLRVCLLYYNVGFIFALCPGHIASHSLRHGYEFLKGVGIDSRVEVGECGARKPLPDIGTASAVYFIFAAHVCRDDFTVCLLLFYDTPLSPCGKVSWGTSSFCGRRPRG